MDFSPITYNSLGKNGNLGSQLFQIASTIGIATNINRSVSFPEEWDYLYSPNGGSIFSIPSFYFTGAKGEDLGMKKLEVVDYFLYMGNHMRKILAPSAVIKRNVAYDLEIESPEHRRIRYTAIHIRKEKGNIKKPELPLTYYYKAMEKIGKKNIYFIFSSDIAWCREYFEAGLPLEHGYHIVYVDVFKKDYEDMAAMSLCDNFILSNSNFAWWGAYLSFNPNKRVFVPSIWYHKDSQEDRRLLFLNYYEEIEC